MSDYLGTDRKKSGGYWGDILKPFESAPFLNAPVAGSAPGGAASNYEVFNIEEYEYAVSVNVFKKKLSLIAEDVNQNSHFALEKLNWSVNKHSYNNSLLKNSILEHLSKKFRISLSIDEVICFILYWKQNDEAVCFSSKTTYSYGTVPKRPSTGSPQDEQKFYEDDAPELIIYTGSGDKYNIRVPALSRQKFYDLLKIQPDGLPEAMPQTPEAPTRTPNAPGETAGGIIPEETPAEEEPSEIVFSKYCGSPQNNLTTFTNMADQMRAGGTVRLEAPSDKYKSVLQFLENSIPRDAKKIVYRGQYDTKQVKLIAQFGKIEGVYYDERNDFVSAEVAIGLSPAISYAISVWSGDDGETSLKNAACMGIQVGGFDFITSVFSAKLPSEIISYLLNGDTDAVISYIGDDAAKALKRLYRSETEAYTDAAGEWQDTAPATSEEVVELKNRLLASLPRNTDAEAPGESPVASPQRAAGFAKFFSAFAGGLKKLFTKTSPHKQVAQNMLSADEIDFTLKLVVKKLLQFNEDYLLNPAEAEDTVVALCATLTESVIKEIYFDENRSVFINELLKPLVEAEVRKRGRVLPPGMRELYPGVVAALSAMRA
ncbi:MAG: hypothetical protein LBR83_05575 [Clostridiales bacterium]|jgi:hypothetical protein|nr:hypothetical protein [Clostridiales bacterium]